LFGEVVCVRKFVEASAIAPRHAPTPHDRVAQILAAAELSEGFARHFLEGVPDGVVPLHVGRLSLPRLEQQCDPENLALAVLPAFD
tara:strand:- start:117 stop:374 length:258 start_codon:yes stop_codon:yes gene_type:complete